MNLAQLKEMSIPAIINLYNEMSGRQAKRMASRTIAERRLKLVAQEQGKWEEETPTKKVDADGTKAKRKPAKRAPKPAPAKAPAKPAPKGKPKRAYKAVPKGIKKVFNKTRVGAPWLNYTYIAIAPSNKNYNPQGFTMQAKSGRTQVLEFIRGSEGGRVTREQVAKKFGKLEVNYDSALFFLTTYGFVRAIPE